MTAKYRSGDMIINNILSAVDRNYHATKTKVMYGSYISFLQAQKYMAICLDMNFIQQIEDGDRSYYILLPRGNEFMQAYQKILEVKQETEEDKVKARLVPEVKPIHIY